MSEEIKVSIIIPVYNTDKYLPRCLDSCINQTLAGIEIIIINDGSTDQSLEIAKEYARKYENVKVSSIVNSGLSKARNTGINLAVGEYLYFCDSDDWMNTDCLEKAYSYAKLNNLEIVTFDANVRSDEEKIQKIYSRFSKIDASKVYTGREFVEKYIDTERVSVWMYMVKRAYLNRNSISFLPNAIYEDHKFFFDCMLHAIRVMYMPFPMYNYCVRFNSIMKSEISTRKILSAYELVCGMLETLDTSGLETEEKLFWLEYISTKIKELTYISYCNVERSTLVRVIKENYGLIEAAQLDFLYRFWNSLKNVIPNAGNLKIILKCIKNTLCHTGVISIREKEFIDDVYEYRRKYLVNILKKIPLSDKGNKVGIYGIGNHTWGLLKNYEEYIGKIEAQIVFVDSNTISYTRRIGESDIINISDAVTENLSCLVISSFLHEKEMSIVAKKAIRDKIPIITLYENKDYWADTQPNEENELRDALMSLKKSIDEKRLFLIGVPDHSNTGDYLISFSERIYLKKMFPDYQCIELTGNEFKENRSDIHFLISLTDTLLVTGGGFLGSLWPDGETVQHLLNWFPENKTVILPQSVYFSDDLYGKNREKKMLLYAKRHNNLTICYREEISLQRGKEIFGEDIPQFLMPDMALLLNGMEQKKNRSGIVLCLRTDMESVFSKEQREEIVDYAESSKKNVSQTSMQWHCPIQKEEQDEILKRKIDEISSAELVISDALHCVISCALTGTPCIALPSRTRKTEGVFQWIKTLSYISYLDLKICRDDIACVQSEIYRLLKDNENKENYYDLHFEEYENQLKQIIE